jgi:hypothetical protein
MRAPDGVSEGVIQAVRPLVRCRVGEDPVSVRKCADLVLRSSGLGAAIADHRSAFARHSGWDAETIGPAATRGIPAHTPGDRIALRVISSRRCLR